MVYVKSMLSLSLLLMELFAVTAKDKLRLNCNKGEGKNRVCNFGDPIEVSFNVEDREAFDEGRRCCNDRIEIIESIDGSMSVPLWTFTCGFQFASASAGIRCPNFTNGKVVFDGVDPTEEYDQQWPLSPGSYRVCHINSLGEKIQKCKKFDVELDEKDRENIEAIATVTPRKDVYPYGEDIVADFNAAVALPNTRVSIRGKTWEAGESVSVYTGCNNHQGDQRWSYYVSDDCLKTRKSGRVTFSPDNTMTGEYLDGGEYEMRIMYYNLDRDSDGLSEIFEKPLAEFSISSKPVTSFNPSKSPISKEPTQSPLAPTSPPTLEPSPKPTTEPPVAPPSPKPTTEPPSASPSPKPTTEPPVAPPSPKPTTEPPVAPPSPKPTTEPPSASPTSAPTTEPPSASPTTEPPVAPPSPKPPTEPPSVSPTSAPVAPPSPKPPTEPIAVATCGAAANVVPELCKVHEKVEPISELFGVSCCSDSEISGWVKNPGCVVWAESKLKPCRQKANWLQAKGFCDGAGARLCTSDEIKDDCRKNTGCGLNTKFIWSSTRGL